MLLLHLIFLFLHAAAYSATAIYAFRTNHHRDMCPFYVAIALIAILHFVVLLASWARPRGREREATDDVARKIS